MKKSMPHSELRGVAPFQVRYLWRNQELVVVHRQPSPAFKRNAACLSTRFQSTRTEESGSISRFGRAELSFIGSELIQAPEPPHARVPHLHRVLFKAAVREGL